MAWLILLGMYGWTLWKTQRRVAKERWIERGIVLGALGGLLGFMTSGVVHYNWGDSEVVMIFYLIMGLSLVVERGTRPGHMTKVQAGLADDFSQLTPIR